MKRVLSYLFVACALVFAGCETEPLDPVIEVGQMPDDEDDGTLDANLNGSAFNDEAITTVLSNGTISITGSNSDGEGLTIMVREAAGTGNFTLPDPANDVVVMYNNGANSFTVSSGTATIDVLNTTDMIVKGSFDVTLTHTGGTEPDITADGNFDVTY
jgi:hypothetical protein